MLGRYHQQQNKWYPNGPGVYLPILKLHSFLTIANLPEHNNSWLCHVQVATLNSLRLKTKIESI